MLELEREKVTHYLYQLKGYQYQSLNVTQRLEGNNIKSGSYSSTWKNVVEINTRAD